MHACGCHDPGSVSLGMLNWADPDALHVRTAVWTAQRDGIIARSEPVAAADPLSTACRFQQSIRLRETQARLDSLHGRIQAVLDGQPMPSFSVAGLLAVALLVPAFNAAAQDAGAPDKAKLEKAHPSKGRRDRDFRRPFSQRPNRVAPRV